MRYPKLFITEHGVSLFTTSGVLRYIGQIGLGYELIAALDEKVQIIVSAGSPWWQYVICQDCGHRCSVADCDRHPDGIACPKCAVPGGMMPTLHTARHDHRIDVFERQGRGWFWCVGSEYPWGPFPTEEDARFDAEAAIGRVL